MNVKQVGTVKTVLVNVQFSRLVKVVTEYAIVRTMANVLLSMEVAYVHLDIQESIAVKLAHQEVLGKIVPRSVIVSVLNISTCVLQCINQVIFQKHSTN